MIQHIAMFRFRDDVDEVRLVKLRANLLALPAKIDTIRSYQVGRDLGLVSSTWDMVVIATFDDEAGYMGYRDHPDHMPIVARVAELATDRAAVQTTLPA